MTDTDNAAIVYDCFVRALALPYITMSGISINLLIEKLEKGAFEDSEMKTVQAYINFLRGQLEDGI